MFLLTPSGLQSVYPSHPSRFHGFLEVMECGVPFLLGGGECNQLDLHDLALKVKWMLGDLMVLYFTIRACHGNLCLDCEESDFLSSVFDNVRLSVHIMFRLYRVLSDRAIVACSASLMIVPDYSREGDWLYDNYSMWTRLMSESYGGESAAVSVMQLSILDPQDLSCMFHSRTRLDRIMTDAQLDTTPVRHMLRPLNDRVMAPFLRRMVSLEVRMRTNAKGEFGLTEIAPWHAAEMYVIPPRLSPLLSRRTGDSV